MSVIKPGAGVLFNYFSIYLNNLSLITSLDKEITTICSDGQASMAVFYTFGSSDVLVLGISDTCEKLNEMQEIQSYNNVKGVMDFFSYYGTAISVFPAPFNLDEEIKNNPIVGTVSIKIRMDAWGEICNNLKNLDELKVKLEEEFKKVIKKTSEECSGLNSTNFKAILVLSYGVEDGIIILLTNSFQYIKTFVANIRTLELLDIINTIPVNVKFKHIIVDTFTTLGIEQKIFESTVTSNTTVISNTYDKLSWNIFLKIRPGHLQYAIDGLSDLSSVQAKSKTAIPIIGRNDLIMESASDCESISDFVMTHTNIIKAVQKNKAIQSIETHLNFPYLKSLESPSYDEISTDEDQPLDAVFLELYTSIKDSKNLTTLERSSFIQIIRKLEFLLNDRYLQDSFITLLPIVKTGIFEYMSLPFKEKVDSKNLSLDLFTIFIECCYTTRYRGNPPFGETAVSPTLGYYSIGTKVLVLLDFISNRILKVIYENYAGKNRTVFFPYCIVTSNVTSTTALVFTPTPLPLSFILLPPQSLTQPLAIVITFLHELGHCVLNSFLLSDKILSNS